MQQLTIRLPEEELARVRRIAKATGLKKSDITRMAIKRFLDEYDSGGDGDLYSRAKGLIGVVESGIPDLGKHHRKHLTRLIKARR